MENILLNADRSRVDAALRAQLAEMSLGGQLLLRRCENKQDEAVLAAICRSAARSERILTQMELCRRLSDEDELRARPRSEDLVPWCRELAECAGELLRPLGVEVRFSADRRCLTAQVDTELLEQLVFELISNGAKAMESGGALTLSLRGTEKAAVIAVGDEGEGLSRRALAELFGESQGPDLTPGAGAGLGLRLARAIAEVHGGLLMVESAPGRGARAAASIPLLPGRREGLKCPKGCTELRDRALTALSDVLPVESYGKNTREKP